MFVNGIMLWLTCRKRKVSSVSRTLIVYVLDHVQGAPNVETLKPPCFQVKLVQMSSCWIRLCKALEEKTARQKDRHEWRLADGQIATANDLTANDLPILKEFRYRCLKSSARLDVFYPGGNIGFAERLTHHS